MVQARLLKRLSGLALGAAALIAFVAKVIARKHRPGTDTHKLLQHLATHTSSPIPELASRIGLPIEAVSRLLIDLEQRGFVQLSEDKGSTHVRIAAITNAGRGQVAS
jgi:DNA-binding MarR family transcriptional regulator